MAVKKPKRASAHTAKGASWLDRVEPKWCWAALAAALSVLLVQTYHRALRPGGYDFSAYLYASKSLLAGHDPYAPSAFPYLYPLFLAFLLIPFTTLPESLLPFLWFALNVLALFGSAVSLSRMVPAAGRTGAGRRTVVLFTLLFLLLFNVIQNNLLNGQVNFIVLYLCLLFFRELQSGRSVTASSALGAAIALKVVPLILLFYLAARSRFREITGAVLWAAFFCLVPYLFAGDRLWDYYASYASHFLAPAARPGTADIPAFYFSLSGALSNAFHGMAAWGGLRIFSALVVLLALGIVERLSRREGGGMAAADAFCLYLAAALLISPKSDTHHLALLFPAIILSTSSMLDNRRPQGGYPWLLIVFWALFLAAPWKPQIPFLFLSLWVMGAHLVLYGSGATDGAPDTSPPEEA